MADLTFRLTFQALEKGEFYYFVVVVAFVRQGSMLLNILAITDCSVGIEVLRGKILMHDLSPLFSLHIDNFAPDSFW